MMSGDAPRYSKEVSSKKMQFFFEILTLVSHFRDSSYISIGVNFIPKSNLRLLAFKLKRHFLLQCHVSINEEVFLVIFNDL